MSNSQANPSPIEELVEQGIAAVKAGDKSTAFVALTQAVQRDPENELAWIWLSGVCARDAERKFCMERVLEINPNSEVAQLGLSTLSAEIAPESPLPKRLRESSVGKCAYPGCENGLSNPKHRYCHTHWKEMQSQPISESATQSDSAMLSSSAIGQKFNFSGRKVNLILAEIGWIVRERKGWIPTTQGKALGAVRKDHHQTGIPFVLWPRSIVENKVLLNTIGDFKGEPTTTKSSSPNGGTEFRNKFPAKHRATDGHFVRSRAELLIDNWLYMSGVVHAYERQLPIEEEAYCDFYIPDGKVYIEYWGLERDPKYQSRMTTKKALYEKHKFKLIELTDEHIRNLDDALPKELLKYDILLN